jgi:CheY-like chemotaxis protein
MEQANATIFLIDDDPIHQQIAKLMFDRQQSSRKILSFQEADLALNYLREHASNPENLPDLILLDINMPVMDGWEFLDEYEKMSDTFSKNIRIHVLTSSVNDEDLSRAKQYGSVEGYLIKPLNRDVILGLLN